MTHGMTHDMTHDKELKQFLLDVAYTFTPMRERIMESEISDESFESITGTSTYLKFIEKLCGVAWLFWMVKKNGDGKPPAELNERIMAIRKALGKNPGPDGKE
jgi:hypothetical protein